MRRPPPISIARALFTVLALAAAPGLPGAAPAPAPAPPKAATRTVALTFDAAWSDDGAASILDTLRDRGVRATFFLAGRFVVRFPDVVRRIAAENHEAGNHTYTHDHLARGSTCGRWETRPGLTFALLKDEMDRTAAAYTAVTGRNLEPVWRAPYGETNREILEWAGAAGYAHVPWSDGLDALDWVADPASRLYQTVDAALARLLRRLAARGAADGPAIVLMHLGSSRPAGERFAEALPALIDGARTLGYRFESASEALAEGKTR
ncbi:MAG: polysaccharide deacetylase family protein [Acidobacteria bacterium]|nr:polysaccharide deacetylase family protein [Acidobacteriota bacterium]